MKHTSSMRHDSRGPFDEMSSFTIDNIMVLKLDLDVG